ncbi:MAG: methyltransferase RsmF C-terminal domain-like protein [Luteibaculaceae bacterium]
MPWCPGAFYLEERPVFTLDPQFHGGAYYVQEASSMFLAHVLQNIVKVTAEPIAALDLCAAPGGKSTLLADFLPKGSLLVSNEIVSNRAKILLENCLKWGAGNHLITCASPEKFAALPALFDLVVVDAPCSGEGLFRKQPESVNEWSDQAVELCSVRQQDILTNVWNCLKPGGYLIYSTCTYNDAENYTPLANLLLHGEGHPVELNTDFFPQVVKQNKQGIFGYHFYPHKLEGEGFYISVIQKSELAETNGRARKTAKLNYKEIAPVTNWINQESGQVLVEYGDYLCAIDNNWIKTVSEILPVVKPFFVGFPVADVKGKLALPSPYLPFFIELAEKAFPTVTMDKTQALKFLSGDVFTLDTMPQGWFIAQYNGVNIGFGKGVGNRFNNYFPKNWRIKMAIN